MPAPPRAGAFRLLEGTTLLLGFLLPLHLASGVEDFRELREEGLAYIDKFSLIHELLDEPTFQKFPFP